VQRLRGFIGPKRRSTFAAMSSATRSIPAGSLNPRRYIALLLVALVVSVAIVCAALTHAVAHMHVVA